MKRILKLESSTERSFSEVVENSGYKDVKIRLKGWPDRLILLNNGYSFYIEFKREGKRPSKLQLYTHKQLRALGFHVYVCDNLVHAKCILMYEEMNYRVRKFKEYV